MKEAFRGNGNEEHAKCSTCIGEITVSSDVPAVPTRPNRYLQGTHSRGAGNTLLDQERIHGLQERKKTALLSRWPRCLTSNGEKKESALDGEGGVHDLGSQNIPFH